MEPFESERTLKGLLVQLSRNKHGYLQLGQATPSAVQLDPSEPPGGAAAGRSPVPPPSVRPSFPPSLRRCLPTTELGMAGLAVALCLAAAAAVCLLPAQGRESDAGWTQQKVGRAAVVFRRLAGLSFVPRPAAGTGGVGAGEERWLPPLRVPTAGRGGSSSAPL